MTLLFICNISVIFSFSSLKIKNPVINVLIVLRLYILLGGRVMNTVTLFNGFAFEGRYLDEKDIAKTIILDDINKVQLTRILDLHDGHTSSYSLFYENNEYDIDPCEIKRLESMYGESFEIFDSYTFLNTDHSFSKLINPLVKSYDNLKFIQYRDNHLGKYIIRLSYNLNDKLIDDEFFVEEDIFNRLKNLFS